MTNNVFRAEDLSGNLLDYFVALAKDRRPIMAPDKGACFIELETSTGIQHIRFSPSREWRQGGPLIFTEKLSVEFHGINPSSKGEIWIAYYGFMPIVENITSTHGSTPLEAAMRCIVKKYIGDDIDFVRYPIERVGEIVHGQVA